MSNSAEFTSLIKKHEGILFKLSNAYADRQEERQDLYQEMVYQLWKSFDSYKGNSSWSTWMYRVALNTAIRHLKLYKRKPDKQQLLPELHRIMEEQDALMDERTQFLYAQIRKLKEVNRAIVLLYLDGKSYEEIGQITGFSPSNIGTRLNRIKAQMRANKPQH
ncbi:RNA polymerase sigma factor [Gilvibacter sp.]|uniref:RNA polymerase sigma factor n=1 Tax=Gilvibacter sp. TaxID=2729997 RepID=UPI003F4A2713